MAGLGGESARWSLQLQKLGNESENITGNALLSAAIVS
jgi:hypothetical protein